MKLRCGLIGCGKVARSMHIPNLIENDKVEIVSICDNDSFQLKKSTGLCPSTTTIYSDYHDMIEKENLDFVDICTPGFTHFDIARELLDYEINVLVEKPLALHLDQAIELRNISHRKSLTVGTMMNYRYKNLVIDLINSIETGKMGKIKKIITVHHGPTVYNDSQWLWDEKKSFNLIYESGIHFIDLQVHLNGKHRKVKYIQPIYDNNLKSTTEIQLIIEYENGAEGYIDLAQTSLKHSSFNSWMDVFGTAQDAFLRWFPPKIYYEGGIHDPIRQFSNEFKAFSSLSKSVIFKTFQKHRREPHGRVIDLFVDSLVSGSDFPLTVDSILPTMTLLEEIKRNIPSYSL